MKRRTIKTSDIPVGNTPETIQDKIFSYIKANPNCSLSDLYHLDPNEGTIRRETTKLLKSRRVKQCLVVVE